jgi:hypothetical protein
LPIAQPLFNRHRPPARRSYACPDDHPASHGSHVRLYGKTIGASLDTH